MQLNDFVAGPCSWDPTAPARLRNNALIDDLEWRSYSTARFLDGAESKVLCTLDVGKWPFETCTGLELLSPTLASRWKTLGLTFATQEKIEELRFREAFSESLALIRSVPALHGTVAGLCRSIHVFLAPDEEHDVSYSDPCLPFSIFLSCPRVGERNRPERLAENILHEALHLQLSLVERVVSLVSDDAAERKAFSPWKQEDRNLRSLLHGLYVFCNLRDFWNQCASTLPGRLAFAKARVATINDEVSTAVSFLDFQHLTPLGRLMTESIRRVN